MSAQVKTCSVNADFMRYCLKRVWMANGASEEHGDAVADALIIGMRQGKLNQGLGVYEAIDLTFRQGQLDITAEPELVKEGPTWAAFDGHRSSGYFTLTRMARAAIAKAKEHGLAIVFGANHNDAGSFSSYAWLAHEKDCWAMTANNSVPMASPLGGMGNVLQVGPLDGICPGGDEPPVWMSTKVCEWYDGDTAQAVLQGTKVRDNSVIDTITGQLSNDLAPYARPVEGYGRVFDQSCFQNLHEPRLYMLNLFLESMESVINPLGTITPEVPTLAQFVNGSAQGASVGGSFYLCIDPSHFGPMEAVRDKSDRLARAVQGTQPLPGGRACRMPGASGWRSLRSGAEEVDVLESHWEPFFRTQAGRHGWSEASLRAEWETSVSTGG
ncbi:malate/L-lactate dehydrogenase subfamily protein [Synechococcus sp. RSCCF101]|uniref:Ldh family oxidoreductase n=1 Tax=Synechococcus sp. RSCCF101 TaxID=2511069 RepID=UPI0012452712|nr:Ldh family oxidoreductase [Synechococcus sp. RSCCF101]QEY32494.1 malate/L-lactate dehydrogenase subfamily protein [Synechococcus sp. RSCCF101]